MSHLVSYYRWKRNWTVSLCLISPVYFFSSSSGATFELLGDLPGGSVRSVATAVSADGAIVTGRGETSTSTLAWVWTAATGMQALPSPGSEDYSLANSISDDGSVIAGEARADSGFPSSPLSRDHATIWTLQPDGSYSALALVPPSGSKFGEFLGSTLFNLDMKAYAISGDGTTVIGQGRSYESGTVGSTFEAFSWTASTGIVALGNLSGGVTVSNGVTTKPAYSSARGIDRLANFTVGTSRSGIRLNSTTPASEAFSFDFDDSSMLAIGDLQDPVFSSSAEAISKDGTTITGEARDAALGSVAFRYTEASGMVSLGRFIAGQTVGNAVNADGSVIVGRGSVTAPSFTSNTSRAFIWTEALGFQDLATVAGLTSTELGANGFLEEAWGISDDGLTIVGVYGDATEDPSHPADNGSRSEYTTPKRQAFIITFTAEELGLVSPAEQLLENTVLNIDAGSSLGISFNINTAQTLTYTLQFSPDLITSFVDQVRFSPNGLGTYTRTNIDSGYTGTDSILAGVITETPSTYNSQRGFWRLAISSP